MNRTAPAVGSRKSGPQGAEARLFRVESSHPKSYDENETIAFQAKSESFADLNAILSSDLSDREIAFARDVADQRIISALRLEDFISGVGGGHGKSVSHFTTASVDVGVRILSDHQLKSDVGHMTDFERAVLAKLIVAEYGPGGRTPLDGFSTTADALRAFQKAGAEAPLLTNTDGLIASMQGAGFSEAMVARADAALVAGRTGEDRHANLASGVPIKDLANLVQHAKDIARDGASMNGAVALINQEYSSSRVAIAAGTPSLQDPAPQKTHDLAPDVSQKTPVASSTKQASLFDAGLVVEKPKDNQKELSSIVPLMNNDTGNGKRMIEAISRSALEKPQAKQIER